MTLNAPTRITFRKDTQSMKIMRKILLLIIVMLAVWKINAIASRVSLLKNYLRTEFTVWKMHRPNSDISGLQAFISTGDEWFSKYHFIAHNGGIVQGRAKSDSREAWELSYSRGIRIIDADLAFTSDNHLVLRHSWADDLEQAYYPSQPSLQEFTGTLIFMKYHSMTAEDMINFMLSHDDLYVAADCKDDPVKIYSALVQTAQTMNAEEVLDRIIVSLYRTADVDRVKSVYPFKHFVLRQYGWLHNWYSLAEFCLKNDVHVVNIFNFVIDADPEGVKILTSKGIRVYAAVVNSLKQMQAYKDLGIFGAVSDSLSEEDWELLK